jgi:hypothetical protein
MKGMSPVEATPHWFSMYNPLWGSLLDCKRGDPGQGRGVVVSKTDSRARERALLLCTL